MNRDFRRERERQKRRDADRRQNESAADAEAFAESKKRQRTNVPAFFREVRSELRRVHWPSRKELASYSLVVFVFVMVLGAYIFGIDQVFAAFILQIFGG